MRAITTAACALLLSGCANMPAAPDSPVTPSGKFQSMMVSSDPPGARCAVWQDGVEIATLDPTPGSVTVAGGGAAYAWCRRPGYLDASGDVGWTCVAREFLPGFAVATRGLCRAGRRRRVRHERRLRGHVRRWRWRSRHRGRGGLALRGSRTSGGIAGLYIASQVAYPDLSYPAEVSLTLTPSEFPSEEARDAYFEPLVRQAESDARGRTQSVCKLVGETHTQCVREREDSRGESRKPATSCATDSTQRRGSFPRDGATSPTRRPDIPLQG